MQLETIVVSIDTLGQTFLLLANDIICPYPFRKLDNGDVKLRFYTRENEEKVYNFLYSKFLEKGKNFNFKSRDISRKLSLDARIIGRISSHFVSTGILSNTNNNPNTHRINTYHTNFVKRDKEGISNVL